MNRMDFDQIDPEFREEYKALYETFEKIDNELKELEHRKEALIIYAIKDIEWDIIQRREKLGMLLRAMDALHPQAVGEYNRAKSWKDKIIWVLKKTNALIPMSTILSKIRINEGESNEGLNGVVRTTINRMIAQNELKEYKNENLKSKHYGLPHWFNEDDSLKNTYRF